MLTRCQENDRCGRIAQARQFVGCKPFPVWARGESRADAAFSEWIVRQLALKVAEQLRGSGIKIAIDDFGAGYSSFSSLRELPFIEFKLDESFVKNCATDATNAAICQTAIDLAHRFGSAAVAEGIETAADLQALMVWAAISARASSCPADAAGALPRFVAPAREPRTSRQVSRPTRRRACAGCHDDGTTFSHLSSVL